MSEGDVIYQTCLVDPPYRPYGQRSLKELSLVGRTLPCRSSVLRWERPDIELRCVGALAAYHARFFASLPAPKAYLVPATRLLGGTRFVTPGLIVLVFMGDKSLTPDGISAKALCNRL
jgi:hypothetical protein